MSAGDDSPRGAVPPEPDPGAGGTAPDTAPDTSQGAPPEPTKSRAGRNLPAAIAVGVLLFGLALASLYVQRWIFLVLVTVAVAVGTDELSQAMAGRRIRLTRFPLIAGAAVLPAIAYFAGPAYLLMAFGLMFLFMVVWRLFRLGTQDFVRDATASGFVLTYAPLMGGFAALIAAMPDGADRVVILVVLSIASDIGGYMTGVLFGKHPMAPKISPKKSWEGFAGSVALQVILGIVLFVVLLDAAWWKGLVAGAIMTVTATLGDFVESAIKRDLGIKDMSNLLPGHGGLMDRLDSLIPNTVVAYTLFALMLGGVTT